MDSIAARHGAVPVNAVKPVTGATAMPRGVMTALIIIGSCLLLFVRLGHYAMWDDEAITAMTARAVLHTGDTSARVDEHNYLVYRNGLLVRVMKDRFTPPLQFYLLAGVMRLFGDGNFACRLPFALCGLMTVLLIIRWLWKAQASALVWGGAFVLLLTSVSFFLFFRQCRYYGLATMLSTGVAYLYCHRDGRRRSVVGLSIVLVLLLGAQYLNYAAVVGCLIIDFLFWGRRERALGWSDWLIILLPQVIVGGIVCSIWNPLARSGADAYQSASWIMDRVHLLAWNWRDMIACEFVVPPLLLICPVMYVAKRSNWLLRAPLALVVYLVVISLAVATQVAKAGNAEVRYLAPVLPLCVAIGILAVWATQFLKPKVRWTLLILSGLSLFIRPEPGGTSPQIHSTALAFYHELVVPQHEQYTPAIEWIKANIKPNQSIFVQPDYMTYPLMFRAGKAIYAWQLTDPPRADFSGLPPIQFYGRVAPDYMIAFGTKETKEIDAAIAKFASQGIQYQLAARIDVHWKDLYRPELIWRHFADDPLEAGDGIFIYFRSK